MISRGPVLGALILSILTYTVDGDAADNLSPLALRARPESNSTPSTTLLITSYSPSSVTRPDMVSRPSPGMSQFKESCEIGSASTCPKAADALIAQGDVEGAQRLLDIGCTRSDAVSCTAYGKRLIERGAAVQARAMFSRGCELGDSEACGFKMPDAPVKATVAEVPSRSQQRDRVAKFKAACLGRLDTGACQLAGTGFLALNEAGPAVAMFQKGCTLGGAPSCTSLGKLAEQRGKADMAMQLFEVACASGDGEACAKAKETPGTAVSEDSVARNVSTREMKGR